MFDINNLGSIKTLDDNDQTLILRFDEDGIAELLQCDFSMLMQNNTSIWYNGTYAPSGTTTENSYYINTSTGDVYSSTTSVTNNVSTTTWQTNPVMRITGSKGSDGIDGKSAYEIAVANGYVGSVTQWLQTLVGSSGADGTRTYFVYSVPTTPISDARGTCRIGDYAIVTFADSNSSPNAGETYVYQGGGKWSGPLTISKATTGPMGPPVTLQSSSSITTTEISEGVYEVSLAQNYLALDASTNTNQIISQGTNSTAFSLSNSAGAKVNIGVSLSGTTNILSFSSSKTTSLSIADNNGNKVSISPDGSYFDSNKISTDGSGNISAISYSGSGNNITVTDPTTSASSTLEIALTNILSKEGNYLPLIGGTISGSMTVAGRMFLGVESGTSYGIEIGDITSGTSNPSYIDLHSSGYNNDYDCRILASGGVFGSDGSGSLNIYSALIEFMSGSTTFLSASPSNTIITSTNINLVGTVSTSGGLIVDGTSSLDNSKITTDGNGNITATSVVGDMSNASITNANGSKNKLSKVLVGGTDNSNIGNTIIAATANNYINMTDTGLIISGSPLTLNNNGVDFISSTNNTISKLSSDGTSYTGSISSASVTNPVTSSTATLDSTLSSINHGVLRDGANLITSVGSSIMYYESTDGTTTGVTSYLKISPEGITVNGGPSTNNIYYNVSNNSSNPSTKCEITKSTYTSDYQQTNNSLSFEVKNSSDNSSAQVLIESGLLVLESSNQMVMAGNILILGSKSYINMSTAAFINMSTGALPSDYLTNTAYSVGQMYFDDTDQIIYRLTSTTTTNGTVTNNWGKFYSSSFRPLVVGNNKINSSSEQLSISFTSDGSSSGTQTGFLGINPGQLLLMSTSNGNSKSLNLNTDGISFNNGTENFIVGFELGFTYSNISTSGYNVSYNVNSSGLFYSYYDKSSSGGFNFGVTSQGITYSQSKGLSFSIGSNGLSYSYNNMSFIVDPGYISMSSPSNISLQSNSEIVLQSSYCILQGNNAVILQSTVPTSNSTSGTSNQISVDGSGFYISNGTRWSRLSEDPDWQIGIVPNVTSYTSTTTSGTAGTTTVPVNATAGYYLLNSKLIGKCSTSGMMLIHTLSNYSFMYDGTTITMSDGETTLHTYGSITSPSVVVSVSGTNILYTYNVTTSSSTTWNWSIVVDQKFITSY